MSRLVKPLILVAIVAGAAVCLSFLAPRRVDPLADARAAIERRDFGEAGRLLDDHLKRNPGDRDARFLAARTARRAGNTEAADRHLRSFQELGGDPELIERETLLRSVQAGEVRLGPALYAYCEARPDDPAVPFMLEALAQGFRQAGQMGQAFACLDKWLALPLSIADRAQGLVWRGDVLEYLDRPRDALEDFRRAVELVPDHYEARLRLATALSTTEPRTALSMYIQLERESSGRPEVRVGIARCHRQLGDFSAAAEVIGPLLNDRPNDGEVVIEAAKLALDRGRPSEAEPLLRHAIELVPNIREPVVQLIRCLSDLGRDAEAAAARAKLAKMNEQYQNWLDEMRKKN